MLHGYCIRGAGDPGPPDGLAGVDDRPVTRVDADDLQLWVSEARDHTVTVDRLRGHERVVRAALESATPLPLRYGTRFRGTSEATDALRERGAEFRESLARVADRVEMSVRVATAGAPGEPALRHPARPAPADPADPAARPGRGYLERRRSELDSTQQARLRADELLAEVESALADLHLPSRRNPLPHGDSMGSVAHLVHRAHLRSYRERIDAVRAARPDLRITLSGPWAPYSFV